MKIYPVSDLVNSPKTDDPRCIEPVRIDRGFSRAPMVGRWVKADIIQRHYKGLVKQAGAREFWTIKP